jgi:hypothetical protein
VISSTNTTLLDDRFGEKGRSILLLLLQEASLRTNPIEGRHPGIALQENCGFATGSESNEAGVLPDSEIGKTSSQDFSLKDQCLSKSATEKNPIADMKEVCLSY